MSKRFVSQIENQTDVLHATICITDIMFYFSSLQQNGIHVNSTCEKFSHIRKIRLKLDFGEKV